MQQLPLLNEHNKEEWPPMHTAEHILNATMDRLFHCGRAFSSHVERKKSKLDYHLSAPLSPEQIAEVERRVNEVIEADMDVKMELVKKADVAGRFDMSRLPDDASDVVRIVRVGHYDECLCVGRHVSHTAEIGHFRISSSRWQGGVQRLVFRLDEA
jgi:misacylated tRNA(Ala) deacylase